jgi:hypothetical protein
MPSQNIRLSWKDLRATESRGCQRENLTPEPMSYRLHYSNYPSYPHLDLGDWEGELQWAVLGEICSRQKTIGPHCLGSPWVVWVLKRFWGKAGVFFQ